MKRIFVETIKDIPPIMDFQQQTPKRNNKRSFIRLMIYVRKNDARNELTYTELSELNLQIIKTEIH
jgi:hypothetical protein